MKKYLISTTIISAFLLIFAFSVILVSYYQGSAGYYPDAMATNSDSASPTDTDDSKNSTDTDIITSQITDTDTEFSFENISHGQDSISGVTPESLKNINDDNKYIIFYPKLESDTINSLIEIDVNYFEYLCNGSGDSDEGKYNLVDYSLSMSCDTYLSVVYKILSLDDNGKAVSADVFTRVYNIQNNEEYKRRDFFNEDFFSYASESVRNYFSGNDATKEYTETDGFLEATNDNELNFDRFSFDDENCYIYFDSNTLYGADGSLYSVKFPLKNITDYLLLDKMKLQNSDTDTGTDTNAEANTDTDTITDTDSSEEPININTNIDPNKPMICLTFDDGPSRNTTRILNCLDKYKSRATFFVVGTNASEHTDILKRIVNSGSQIGNHSMNHTSLSKQSIDDMHNAIESVNDIVEAATGKRPKIVRPPYGSTNETVKNNLNYPFILWDIDTLDWSTRNSTSTVDNIMTNVQDGSIILMHDLYSETADAVEIVVPKLIEEGYQLVTVEEMFKYKNMQLTNGTSYYSAR